MTQETKNPLSLATKLAAIGKEIGAVDKSGKNAQQNYNYIEYGVVAGRIRELFDKYRVIIVPSVDSVQHDEIVNKYGGKGYHFILTMTFELINGDNPEDREIATWAGEASDYGDKGVNKAETAGTKYFLMRLFNISEKGEEEADKKTPEQAIAQHFGKPTEPLYSPAAIAEAKIKLGVCTSMEELKNAYKGLGSIAKAPEVIKYKDEMKGKVDGEL
jgi:hypothetical protein